MKRVLICETSRKASVLTLWKNLEHKDLLYASNGPQNRPFLAQINISVFFIF